MMGGGGGAMMAAMSPNAKPGDWMCPGCGDHQFARNAQCRKCGHAKPEGTEAAAAGGAAGAMMGMAGGCGGGFGGAMGGGMSAMAINAATLNAANMKPGDWICQGCGDHQFAKNGNCRKCGAPRPDGTGASGAMAGGQMGMLGMMGG